MHKLCHFLPHPGHDITCIHINSLCVSKQAVLSLKTNACNWSSMLKQQELSIKDEGRTISFFLLASLELRKWFSWVTRLNSNYFNLQNLHITLTPFIMSGNGWLRSGSVKPHYFVLSLIAKRPATGRKLCWRLGEDTTECISIWRKLNCQGFLCFSIHRS